MRCVRRFLLRGWLGLLLGRPVGDRGWMRERESKIERNKERAWERFKLSIIACARTYTHTYTHTPNKRTNMEKKKHTHAHFHIHNLFLFRLLFLSLTHKHPHAPVVFWQQSFLAEQHLVDDFPRAFYTCYSNIYTHIHACYSNIYTHIHACYSIKSHQIMCNMYV